MAYVVRYGKPDARERQARRSGKRHWIGAVCVLLAVLLLQFFFPEAVSAVRRVVIPGDDAVTIAAFQSLLAAAEDGESFAECITVFCEEVIYAGK